MLSDKDIFLMEILEKTTISNNLQLTILSGKKEISTTRKALKKLIEKGYVEAIRMGDHMVYTLTTKGLSELEKKRRPYDVKGFSTEHLELVTEAACWLYIKTECSIHDMFFDRQIAKLDLGHAPDIMIARNCIEVELNVKSMSRLEQNFRTNSNNFYQQIWFVPNRLSSLQNKLRCLASKYNSKLLLLTIENLKETIASYDLKSNMPKMEEIKGTPSTLEKQKKVILHDQD